MVTVDNFRSIRINNNYNFADITSYGNHCSNAFYMTAYEMSGKSKSNKFASRVIQVRRKENQIATFVQMHSDIGLPEWWTDSELLYEWREDK